MVEVPASPALAFAQQQAGRLGVGDGVRGIRRPRPQRSRPCFRQCLAFDGRHFTGVFRRAAVRP